MSSSSEDSAREARRHRLAELLHKAAAKAVQEEDPWSSFNIPGVPAERIIRHLYDPHTQTWSTDETIVKMESTPFTHGAMRFCYRMKKRATPPLSSSNHRFHRTGWTTASNYVAKAYCSKDGQVDTNAKQAIQNDILLQYEAQRWAARFNESDPPSKITFLRAYAIEFPNRDGSPWFAVERFIAGKDSYGAGFVKHNTNSGFVDTDLRRVTPQVFSAHSFYASNGNRLVADIQGVGDLYTDPQVLSSDYRFGDGDLGPRGMALFFKTFRHCGISDAMGVPIFPLSKNELKHQAKYHDDEETVSDVDANDELSFMSHDSQDNINSFQKLDLNRMRRRASLMRPDQIMENSILHVIHNNNNGNNSNNNKQPADMMIPEEKECDFEDSSVRTEKRSNMRNELRASIRKSLRLAKPVSPQKIRRTKSDVDEVEQCLLRARQDFQVDLVRDYHRRESGELRTRKFKDNGEPDEDEEEANGGPTKKQIRHKSTLIGTISPPMVLSNQTLFNLGKVHYQLAILHGMGRFPEVVPDVEIGKNSNSSNGSDPNSTDKPPHDSFSVLFHLSHAASLQNAPACLALGRVHAGLGTHVSELIDNPLVPLDFEAAKELLRRAMDSMGVNESENSDEEGSGLLLVPMAPRVAAGCLLFQILQDERHADEFLTIDEDEGEVDAKKDNNKDKTGSLTEMMTVAQDTLKLFELMEKQQAEADKAKESLARSGNVAGTGNMLHVGDRVQGDYFMEGTYYPGTVLEVNATEKDGETHVMITVQYDDDGSSEALPRDHVRMLIPPTATQTTVGGPLSDEEAFGGTSEDQDDDIPIETYELAAELAELKVEAGDKESASTYYQEAAEGAMQDNKMKMATEWSLKAAELQD
ncbi:Eukaryotic elongation factor 2 kinase [Seminavis robusta]|uniref:Eukaryotic elongation factor 2 kinase n=1 Tax=Seminavis robusta TaxID=568900 RepID=A0A9N8HEZ1_9STRA|nr:Eukaryotic elongation factor 2 kinase [Seminavis robusta]|eukprot:Sro325_g117770.1 Eukaryotic elongation factor 2 kinase (869) ;mRNA; r:26145-28858